MSSKILNKIRYIKEILSTYKNWEIILINQLLKKNTRVSELRNGIKIVGGDRSIVQDLVYEVYIKNLYFPKNLQINKNDCIMDIGTNIGVFSLYAAKKGAGKIYAVEPLSSNCQLIKKNFKINNFSLPVIINKAVTDKIGSTKMYLGNLDSHCSLTDHNHEGKFTDSIKVRTTTLEDIILRLRIRKIDFLKIDCEGSEGEIVKSTKKSVWSKIDKISMEYHDDSSSLSHQRIAQILRKMEFKITIKQTGKFFGYIYAWK